MSRRSALLLATLLVMPLTTQAAAPPTMDGFLMDAFWTVQARVWSVEDPRLPGHKADFYLGYDDRYLYFAADISDPNVYGRHRRRQDDVWADDCVSLLLTFDDGTPMGGSFPAFECALSAAGGIHTRRLAGELEWRERIAEKEPARTVEEALRWTPPIRWAVMQKVGTTPNLPTDQDAGYVIEARLAWEDLGQPPPVRPEQILGVNMVAIARTEDAAVEAGLLCPTPDITLKNYRQRRLWPRIRLDWPGPLPWRGQAETLPLSLGSTAEGGKWEQFIEAEDDPKGPWLNQLTWTEKFEEMRRLQLNAMALLHPHPYPGLLSLSAYPGACSLTRGELERNQRQFQWILSEAKRNGISVYLGTWNICLPRGWAADHQLTEFGADTPFTRRYTRYAVGQLFRQYPDLAGLATMPGDQPPGCVDFVLDAVVGGLFDAFGNGTASAGLAQPPALLFWARGCLPADTHRVVQTYPPYPRTRILHHLQGEQWFKPTVDPRLPRLQTSVSADPVRTSWQVVPGVAIGGPQGALRYLFWSDPEWMYRLAIEMRRQGVAGMFFDPQCRDYWLADEALAIYAYDAPESFDAHPWELRLAEAYGVGDSAANLLETMQHASAIVPRLLCLLHSQSERFMPQMGLPLVHYLEMPTLSSFVSDRGEVLDEDGLLIPCFGPAWPNPLWGEAVATIAEDIGRSGPREGTSPESIAGDIRHHVDACKARLAGLRRIEPVDPQRARTFAGLLDRLELSTALGEHFYHRIQAAAAWERYRTQRGRSLECLRSLEMSVEAWDKVVATAERVYPDPLPYWESQMVSPPPWSARQIWSSYRLVTGHWRDQPPRFRRELELIREQTSTRGQASTLPLWDHITAEPQDSLELVQRISFNLDRDLRYELGPGAVLTEDGTLVIEPGRSIAVDTRPLGPGSYAVLRTNPSHATLVAYRPYQISIAYRVIERGSPDGEPFEIGVAPRSRGPALGEHRFWGAPNGYVGTRIIKIPPLDHDGYVVFVNVHGQAAIVIDDLQVWALKVY